MSKKYSQKQQKSKNWIFINVLGVAVSVIVAFIIANLNGNGRSDIIRDWGSIFVVVAALCTVAALVSIFMLKGAKKAIGVLALVANFILGYLILFSYSFSFYGM